MDITKPGAVNAYSYNATDIQHKVKGQTKVKSCDLIWSCDPRVFFLSE